MLSVTEVFPCHFSDNFQPIPAEKKTFCFTNFRKTFFFTFPVIDESNWECNSKSNRGLHILSLQYNVLKSGYSRIPFKTLPMLQKRSTRTLRSRRSCSTLAATTSRVSEITSLTLTLDSSVSGNVGQMGLVDYWEEPKLG